VPDREASQGTSAVMCGYSIRTDLRGEHGWRRAGTMAAETSGQTPRPAGPAEISDRTTGGATARVSPPAMPLGSR